MQKIYNSDILLWGDNMAWFFTEPFNEDTYTITGENAKHIEKSLRMKAGEEITLVDSCGMQYSTTIEGIVPGNITVKVNSRFKCQNEPDVAVTLYQALPKGDKMDFIVQKAVELGVTSIVPVISARCISRPDEKTLRKKAERWQKIALQAAQQSRRGVIPQVKQAQTFKQAVASLDGSCCNIIFYECGGEHIGNVIDKAAQNVNIFIGSEGGFEQAEVDSVVEKGGSAATLGRRVLRAETAPLTALSVIMYETGNLG